MSVIEDIIDWISEAIERVVEWVSIVINGIINFFKDVVGYFKKLFLDPKKDTPFIADASKLKGMIKSAPVKNVGIFSGVYDEETDEIKNGRVISADELDDQTRQTLGNEPLVVLN